MGIPIDPYPGLLSVEFSCCCDQNEVTKDILIILKMALNNPFFTIFCPIYHNNALCQYISVLPAKRKFVSNGQLTFRKVYTCTLYIYDILYCIIEHNLAILFHCLFFHSTWGWRVNHIARWVMFCWSIGIIFSLVDRFIWWQELWLT